MFDSRNSPAQKGRNPARGGVITGAVLSIVGALACLYPFLADMDMMNGGFALILIGFVVLLSGLITLGVFLAQAASATRMQSGVGVLAHWQYSETEQQAATQLDYDAYQGNNRVLLMIVTGFIVACTVLFSLISVADSGEINGPFVMIMLGVLLLLAIVSMLAPQAAHRQAQTATPEAIISRNGLIVFGAQHTWGSLGSKLLKVEIVSDGDRANLQFTIRYLTRASLLLYSTYTVNVPIPPGCEGEAGQVVAGLMGQ